MADAANGVTRDATLTSGDSVIMGSAVALARLGPGSKLGPFELVSRVELGTRDVRYSATDTRTQQAVMLRLLRPDGKQRAAREHYRRLATLRLPQLVETLEVAELGEVLCVVQAAREGTPLRAWFERDPRRWRARLEAMRGLVACIATVHEEAGLVHGALRPRAVQVNAEGGLELGEFIPLAPTQRQASAELDEVTAYLAPEQLDGQLGDARSDQYSLCVLTYEAVYGEHPFAARRVETLRSQMADLRVRPVPPRSRVPSSLRTVLLRGLAHAPAQRWGSVAELAAELAKPHRKRPLARLLGMARS